MRSAIQRAATAVRQPILTLLLLPLPFAELTLDLLLDWFPLLALESSGSVFRRPTYGHLVVDAEGVFAQETASVLVGLAPEVAQTSVSE